MAFSVSSAARRWFRFRSKSEALDPPGDSRDPSNRNNFRVVVFGPTAVGKTCIVARLMGKEFVNEEYKATVEELHRCQYEFNGKRITVDILDTSGTYQFPAMRRLAVSTGDAFILVYDLSDERSFEKVRELHKLIVSERDELENLKNTPGEQSRSGFPPLVIVGNKSDLNIGDERRVRQTVHQATANLEMEAGYAAISAKIDENVKCIFRELLAQARVKVDWERVEGRRRKSWPVLKKDKQKLINDCNIS